MALLKHEWFHDFTWKIRQDDGVVWWSQLCYLAPISSLDRGSYGYGGRDCQ